MSQCDEQTFRSSSEFRKAGAARAPLAKFSRQVSEETDKALCEPTAVLWRNKEAGPQCKPITFKNLVVHFDQGKFEEVLSGGGLMLHARKHRKVSMTKVLEQKPGANYANTPQPRVWLVRFLANLSSLIKADVEAKTKGSGQSLRCSYARSASLLRRKRQDACLLRQCCQPRSYSGDHTFDQLKINNSRQPRSHEQSYCTTACFVRSSQRS